MIVGITTNKFKSLAVLLLFIANSFIGSAQLDATFSSPAANQCPNNLFTINATNTTYQNYSWEVTGPPPFNTQLFSGSSIGIYLTASGLYNVKLTVSDGVTSTINNVNNFLRVYDVPVISYTLTPTTGCAPLTVNFNGSCTPGSGSLLSFSANSGDGTSYNTEDFNHIYTNGGTFTPSVTVTNSFGCNTNGSLTPIIVEESPSLTSPLNPNSICSGTTFNYTPTSTISGTTYTWTRTLPSGISGSGSSSGSGNISETLTNSTSGNIQVTYVVTLTAPNGCFRVQNVVVTVRALPTVSINPASLSICSGGSGTLTATGSPLGGSFTWSTGSSTSSIIVTTAGTRSVTYSDGTCTSASASSTVTITSAPVINSFTYTESSLTANDGTICSGSSVTITANVSPSGGTYAWSTGGSTASIVVSPTSTTSYSLTYNQGCAITGTTSPITVLSLPVPNINPLTRNFCAPPVTTTFTNTSTNAGGGVIWNFSNGNGTPSSSTSNTPSVTYNSSGTFAVSLTATSTSGCQRTTVFSNAITIGSGSPPSSLFSPTTPLVQCYSTIAAPANSVATNSVCFEYTGSGADTLVWNWGDGSPLQYTDQAGIWCKTYNSAGTYNVIVTPYTTVGANLGCAGAESTFSVTINGPVASFTASTINCNNQRNRTFTSTSTGISGSASYLWDLGDGNTSNLQTVSHTYSNFNTPSTPYIVRLTVTDLSTGCPASSTTTNIFAFPNNLANFQSYNNSTASRIVTTDVCLNGSLSFYNETPAPQYNDNNSNNNTTTLWNFNNTNSTFSITGSAFRGNPEPYKFLEIGNNISGDPNNNGGISWVPGIYSVGMRTTNSTTCFQDISKSNYIKVHGVIGTFSLADTVLCANASFTVTDNSTAPVTSIASRVWNWGDGSPNTTGNNSTPSHTYTNIGTYTITLTATDQFGCSKTTSRQVTVRKPTASFTVDRNFICPSQTVSVTNNSTGVGLTSYAWLASTPTVVNATGVNPTPFTFTGDGSIRLTVTDNLGCTDVLTLPITVQNPVPSATASPSSVSCFNPPTVVSFTNTSTNNVDNTSAVWNFNSTNINSGNGTSPVTSNNWQPSVTYSLPGTYIVTLQVGSLSGCTSTVQEVATVTIGGPSGTVNVTNENLTGCSCYTANMTVTTANVTEARLLYGDGQFIVLTPNTTQNVSYSYCNTGATTITRTPSLYISNGTCNGFITANQTINIKPTPTVNAVPNQLKCAGTNSDAVNFDGNVPSATYTWSRTNTNISASPLPLSGTGNIASFLTDNTTLTSINSVFTVTPSFDGCTGSPTNFTITVGPRPVSTVSTTSVCVGGTVTTTPNTGGTWTSTNPTAASITSSGIVSVGTSTTTQTTTLRYTETTSGCFRDHVLTVNPRPIVTASSLSVCVGNTITLSPNSGGTWVSSAPSIASVVSGTGVVTGEASGTANFTYTVTATGCSNTTSNVTVNPLPVVALNPTSICQGQGATATPSTLGTWTVVTGTGVSITNGGIISSTTSATGPASFRYRITSTGCEATTGNLTINTLPVITAPTTLCMGSTGSLTPSTGGTWTSSNTAVATVTNAGVITPFSAGTVTFTFTEASTGCSSTTSTVTINNLPTVTSGTSVCVGSIMSPSLTPSSGGTWSASNGSATVVPTTGVVTGVSAGTVTFTYTETSTGCSRTTNNVTVNALPTLTVSSTAICIGATTTVTPSTGGTWVSSLPSVATVDNAGLVTGISAGSAVMTFTNSTTGCSRSTSAITVNALPTFGTTKVDPSLCNATDGLVTLTGLTANVSYRYTYVLLGNTTGPVTATSNGSGQLTVSNLGAGTYTFSIELVSTGCQSATQNVTLVNPNAPDLDDIADQFLCGTTYTLPTITGTNLPGNQKYSTAPNGGGTTLPVGTVISSTQTIYIWTQTPTTGGCSDQESFTITISSNPTISAPSSLCVGATAQLTPNTNVTWTSSNTSRATVTNAGVLTGIASGNVTITCQNNTTQCSSSAVVNIIARPTLTAATSVCENGTITISPTSGGTWTSSDENIATITNAGVVSGVSPGLVNFTYTSTSTTCSNTTSDITVKSKPTVTSPASVCMGSTGLLSPTTGGTWTSLATGVATVTNAGVITPVAPGNVTFRFIETSSNCSDTTLNVVINPLPVLGGPNQVCIGANISLTPSTGGIWSGGNSTIATISPSGVVNGEAVGTTSFIFTDASTTCSNTSATITVNPNPVINGPSQVCVGSTVTLTGGTGFTWTSNNTDLLTINSNTGVALGVAPGTTTVRNTNPFTGCFANSSPITINALPVVSVPTSVCVGGNVTISPTSGGTWTALSPNASVSNAGVVTGINAGSATFRFTEDITTCSNTTSTINVIANPVITLTNQNPSICNGTDGSIIINGLSANTSFQYTYTGPTSATLVSATTNGSGQITIPNLGAGTYTVTVTNVSTGCTSAEVITTLINPNAPNINDIADQTLCGGTYTLPTITGSNLTNAQYWTASGGTGTVLPVGTVISTIGLTTIYMYSATPGGCSDEESFTITINTVPIVSAPANVCVGETVTLSPTSGGSWAVASGPSFASVQNTGVVTGLAAGTSTFIFTENGTNCTNTTSAITVKAVQTVNAGPDQTICSNSTVTLAGSRGGSATASTWSGGTGSFSNPSSLTPVYSLGLGDVGTTTLTLTAIDPTGICPNVSDQVLITIDQAPVVNAGTNDIFCSSDTYQLSATIGGSATGVTWTKTGSSAVSTLSSTTILNPVYTPSLSDVQNQPIVFTATTNDPFGPCPASISQVTISISPKVEVNAGNDFVVCSNNTNFQLNGSITGATTSGTWSGGSGTFTPSANSLTTQYQPTAAELAQPSVTLILTSDDPVGPCQLVFDNITISFAQPAIVDAGMPQTICSGAMVSQTGSFGGAASSITWASTTLPIIARGTITNSPNALTINYMPSSTEINQGFVDLEIYSNDPAGPCGVERDTVRITINPTPILLNNTSISQCSGNPLNITLTVQNGLNADFGWEMLDNPNVSGEPTGFIYSSTITNTLVNNSLVDQDVIINVTPTIAGGCTGTQVPLTVTVHPRPTMAPVSDQTLCSLTPTNAVSFSSNISGTIYSWTNDLTSTYIGIGATGTNNIPSFTPPGFTTTSIANIVVTPEFSGCQGIPQTFSYTFLPVSTVNDPLDLVVCHNEAVPAIIFTGNNPNTVYNWQNSESSIGLVSNGQGDINTFTGNNPPPSITAITSTLTVTPQLNTCFGVPQTFTITVKPIPVLQSINDRRLCIGNVSNTIAFVSSPSGTTFAWTNSLPAIGLSSQGTTNFIPSFTASHSTGATANQVDTGYINIIPTFNGCAGQPVNFLIMVNPILQADPIPNMVFCEGETFPQIVITGNAPDVNYNWTYNNIATGLAQNGLNIIPSDIVLAGNFVETGNVTIIPTHPSLPNCLGTQTSFSITVKPKPNVYVSQPVQGNCHAVATIPVNFSSDVLNTSFTWQNSNNMSIQLNSSLDGIPSGSGNLPSFIGHNTTVPQISQTANYNVFSFANGCVGDTAFFSITVDPKPTVISENNQTLCAGQSTLPISFTGNFGGSTTYNWSSNNVSIFPSSITVPGTNSIPSFIAQNSTSVTQVADIICEPVFGFCVGVKDTLQFIVKPKPTVNPVQNQSLCSGSLTNLVQFTGNMNITPSDGPATYTWNNNNTSINLASTGIGDILPFQAGNTGNTVVSATIQVTPEINGCFGDAINFTITTVDPIPIVNVIPNIELCAGETTNAICFTGPNPVTSFNWSATNGSLIGLSNSGITNSSTGFCIPPFITTNDNSITDIVAVFTVSPVYFGCVGTPRTFNIRVKPIPNVFITPETQTVCANTNTQNVLFTGNIQGTSFDWTGTLDNIGINDFGSGNITSFTALNTTNFNLVDTIFVTPSFNGCSGIRDTALIIVKPISTVNIAVNSFNYCHGENVPQNCFVGNNSATTYQWTNSNTGIGLASSGSGCIPPFIAQNTGLQNDTSIIIVTPILNGCAGIPDTFMIYTKPIPNVYPISDINICAGATVPTITFQGDMTSTTTFNWVGNTNIGLNPNFGSNTIPSFVGVNNSQVILLNSIIITPSRQGCVGLADTLLISVNPISELTIVDSVYACNGEVVPLTVINGTSPSAIYSWTNNNTLIGLSSNGVSSVIPYGIPSFTATNNTPIIQYAQVIVTPFVNNCAGISDTIIFAIKPTPTVDPVASQSLCSGTTSTPITFSGTVANTVFNWSHNVAAVGLVPTSGTGTIPSFVGAPNLYPNGDIIATVTVTPTKDGCSGLPISFTITNYALPFVNAGFDTTLCLGQFIIPQGSGLSQAGLSFGFQWSANPNNVNNTTPLNGQPYYPDVSTTLTVVGTDTNLCQNRDSLVVTYLQIQSPQVYAGLDTALCFGESITLCAIHDGDLVVWNNGVFDCQEFTPINTNSYIVTASDVNGCYSKDTINVIINTLPIITANSSDNFICFGDSTMLWGSGIGIDINYIWNNNVVDSVGFIPNETNTYTVIGTDSNGCKDTADIVVTVNPNPVVLFSSNINYGGCLPFTPIFTDLTIPISGTVEWDFGDGTTSNQLGTVTNFYDNYGCYDVTLTSTTPEGCTASFTQQDYVCVNQIIAGFDPDTFEQPISNPTFEFTNTSINATSYQWFFTPADSSYAVHPDHTFEEIGLYTITLIASAQDGCSDTARIVIKVRDEIIVYVPNSFTPDGNGLNDTFFPVMTAGYDRSEGYYFTIYNRWGNEVFYSQTIGEGWDGTYKGEKVQFGTYLWTLRFKDSQNNKIHDFNGHVNLVR